MPDVHAEDEPANDSVSDHKQVTRRDFGKKSVGVAVVGGLSAGVLTNGATGAAAAGQPRRQTERDVLENWKPSGITGSGHNDVHPDWGQANTIYPRVAPAAYVDGVQEMPPGPNARYISNRIFNDRGVTLYSPRNVSGWGFVWGQFIDHTFALRLGRRQTGEDGEEAHIPTDPNDPVDEFRNDLGVVLMNRSIPADGSGITTPRDQINQRSSFLDAAPVYGSEEARLNWLREGPADGDMTKSGARLLMRDGYLPRRNSRGNPDTAPLMVFGAMEDPGLPAVAGDHRANENSMLLATQTLFAREHNRIVDHLPRSLSEEHRFQIARAVVIAEQQYITYREFLPAMGVTLPRYTGHNPEVDTGITNEFATIAYRAHSIINNRLDVKTEARRYDKATVDWFRSLGITVTQHGKRVHLAIPHGYTTFFQPDLVEQVELGPVLAGIGLKPMRKNDHSITNMVRSLVAPMDPTTQAVNDLAAVDVERARDHGLPSYNDIREAFGLARKTSFRAITGENSEEFPADPLLTPGNEINDVHSMDYVELWDIHGNPTTPEADNATRGRMRTPLAARLKAIYGDVDKVDAFVGMVCERHLSGREFGELQLAIWRRQFAALRDGDRQFYENNPILKFILRRYGIDYRTTLADVIARNTDIPRHELGRNVFIAKENAGTGQRSTGSATVPAAATAATAGVTSTASGPDRKPWYCGQAEL